MSASAAAARLIRPLRSRDPHEKGRVASNLELLTDLCFVVAVGQASAALHHGLLSDHPGVAVLGYVMAFFAIWWAWLNFVWFSSAYDNDDAVVRLLTMLQIVGVLMLAAGIATFAVSIEKGEAHPGLMIAGYVVMRVGLVVLWLRAARSDPARRDTCLRYAIGIVVVQAGWIGYYFLARVPALIVPVFFFLVVCELLVPPWAERAGLTTWHPHHIAERYGSFFIIVLGETILSATVAVQQAFTADAARRGDVALVTAGGILIVLSLWWLYFSRDAAEVLARARDEESPVAYLFGFGHYVIFAAAAAVGAGLAARAEYAADPEEHPAFVTAAAVTVPVALLLMAMWVVHLRLNDPSRRTALPFFAAAGLILLSTFLPHSELVTGLVLAVLVGIETRLALADAGAARD